MKSKKLSQAATVKVSSPCISQCCLNDRDICLGCFRHLDEITGWHDAGEQEKRQILRNCKQRKEAAGNG